MKKIISLVLSMMLLIVYVPAFAAKEDSEKMQEVLLLVKSKITVPDDLSEFSGNISDYNNKVTYHFNWTTPHYEKSMSVSSDEKGRIKSYNTSVSDISDKRLSKISKSELIDFAEKFLRKTVPEAFVSDSDYLAYADDGYYTFGNQMYNFLFQREKDGVKVKDNSAIVVLCVENDEICVRNMNINFAYDTNFSEPKHELENYKTKYQELFPLELIYRDEYKPLAKKNEPKTKPMLIYRVKDDDIGYIDSATGEILKEDSLNSIYREEVSAENGASMKDSAGGASLTPQEIAELKNIEGLLSVADIEKSIKKLPYIDFLDELKIQGSRLFKDNLGKYYYRMNYFYDKEDFYKSVNIEVNAKSGELVRLSNNSGKYTADVYSADEENKTLTDEEKNIAEKKITEFLDIVAKDKISEMEIRDKQINRNVVSKGFVRVVNGIKYVDNGISISFDVKNNLVRNYNLNYTEADFQDPKEAISDSAAYEKILNYAPIIPLYIENDGVYKKVFTLEKNSIAVEALTGEIINKEIDKNYTYSDISGHWVEEAAIKLSEIQVGIPGGKLEPERKITQEEFLKLLSASLLGEFYVEYSSEELYEMLIREGFVTEEEKSPEKTIKREDAFVYVIRMAGFEKVAKLSDIYKVSYKDENSLSEGKIGYAAILSGLGVICGDGGKLRPQDELTRAEAIMIAYKYLLSL